MYFEVPFVFNKDGKCQVRRRSNLLDCLLLLETGASFGLSFFCADLIDYVEC